MADDATAQARHLAERIAERHMDLDDFEHVTDAKFQAFKARKQMLVNDITEALTAATAAQGRPCIPMCRLATSTHHDAEGVERCDLCGFPAEQPAATAAQEAELEQLRRERELYENAQCVTCAAHLDGASHDESR